MRLHDDLVMMQPTHGRSKAQHIANSDPASDHDTAMDYVTVFRRPLYHAAMTITTAQPGLLVPQPTGDLLRITLPYAGPTVSSRHGNGSQRTVHAAAVHSAGPTCSDKAQQFLLPASEVHHAVPPYAQRLYRGHQQPIVAAAFLQDATAMITVDIGGLIALWPMHDSAASPVGWFEPTRTLQLAVDFVAPVLRGSVAKVPSEQTPDSREAGLEPTAGGALVLGC